MKEPGPCNLRDWGIQGELGSQIGFDKLNRHSVTFPRG